MTNEQGNRGWAAVMVAAILMVLAAAIVAPAQTFTSLHSFDQSDGQKPEGALMQAADGNLYGETSQQGLYGGGTIYRITPGGQLTTLYNFCALENCLDGSTPSGGLIQAADGNFYGTTEYGGDSGRGTVFRMTVGATITTLYSFCLQTGCADGDRPEAGLAQGENGNFYGTTGYGGDHGFGALFRVSPGGAVSTIYSFCSQPQHNCEDGTNPYGGVIAGTDGNLYGTTHVGGPNSPW